MNEKMQLGSVDFIGSGQKADFGSVDYTGANYDANFGADNITQEIQLPETVIYGNPGNGQQVEDLLREGNQYFTDMFEEGSKEVAKYYVMAGLGLLALSFLFKKE